jgi:hypothetical protein
MGRDGRKTVDGERHLPHRIVASLHVYRYNNEMAMKISILFYADGREALIKALGD